MSLRDQFARFRPSPFGTGIDPNQVESYNDREGRDIQPAGFPNLGNDQVRTDASGIQILDPNSNEKVRLGKLGSGAYGLEVKDSAGVVLIADGVVKSPGIEADAVTSAKIAADAVTADKIAANSIESQHFIAGSVGRLPSGVEFGLAQTKVTADGIEVNDGAVDRVTLGALGGGDYGLKVVNAGSTVIIDGTSNVFKIAATGNLSAPSVSSAEVPAEKQSSVNLSTGLTYSPAFLGFLDTGNGALGLPYILWVVPDAANQGQVTDSWSMECQVVNTNQTQVRALVKTRRAAGLPSYSTRYYVLREVAF